MNCVWDGAGSSGCFTALGITYRHCSHLHSCGLAKASYKLKRFSLKNIHVRCRTSQSLSDGTPDEGASTLLSLTGNTLRWPLRGWNLLHRQGLLCAVLIQHTVSSHFQLRANRKKTYTTLLIILNIQLYNSTLHHIHQKTILITF